MNQESKADVVSADVSPKRILVVDDDPVQRKLAKALLSAAGFVVATAADATQALAAARETSPDLVVSDVIMGEIDGFTLCRLLRREATLANVPIVLLSAHFRGPGDRVLARAVGALDLAQRTPDFTAEMALVHRALALGNGAAAVTPEASSVPELYTRRVSGQLAELAGKVGLSERLYRTLFENARDAISLLTADGVVLEANRRWEEITGLPAQEIAGRHIREFVVAGHEEAVMARYPEDVSRGASAPVPIKCADGSTVFLEFALGLMETGERPLVFSIGRDVTASVEARRLVENSEARLRLLLENIPDVVWAATPEGKMTFVSANVETITGFTVDECLQAPLGFWLERVNPADREHVRAAHQSLLTERGAVDIEYRWLNKDGHWRWFHHRVLATHVGDGVVSIDGLLADITERKQLEKQFLESQRMEAIAQLTGGVAHDFNNILAAILGNVTFLIDGLQGDDQRLADAVCIQQAAERAAALVRQLMAFSRRQAIAPTSVDVNRVVTDFKQMLRRVIGENVALAYHQTPDLGGVFADVGQIEQVIMNLVVNARDAMPGGGTITIETANVDVGVDDVSPPAGVAAGRYVTLAISDTGCGMDQETQRRVFEPFFTTKEPGKGTGLGLSTCYGIVKQSGGHIALQSEPGKGTVFRVFLPRKEGRDKRPTPAPSSAADLCGTETILLVEDDENVRETIKRVLVALGYQVLLAQDAAQALALSRESENRIDLVLSDVVMPGQNGFDLVQQLEKTLGTRSLLMSGYTDRSDVREGLSGVMLLQKPFGPITLVQKVREALNAPAPA